MNDYPEGTIFIEIREIYDGWSVAELPDGTLVNRWDKNDRRYVPAQEWIDLQTKDKSCQHGSHLNG